MNNIHINKNTNLYNNPPLKHNNCESIKSENKDNNNILLYKDNSSSKDIENESKENPFINNYLFEGSCENLIDNHFDFFKNENSSSKKMDSPSM